MIDLALGQYPVKCIIGTFNSNHELTYKTRILHNDYHTGFIRLNQYNYGIGPNSFFDVRGLSFDIDNDEDMYKFTDGLNKLNVSYYVRITSDKHYHLVAKTNNIPLNNPKECIANASRKLIKSFKQSSNTNFGIVVRSIGSIRRKYINDKYSDFLVRGYDVKNRKILNRDVLVNGISISLLKTDEEITKLISESNNNIGYVDLKSKVDLYTKAVHFLYIEKDNELGNFCRNVLFKEKPSFEERRWLVFVLLDILANKQKRKQEDNLILSEIITNLIVVNNKWDGFNKQTTYDKVRYLSNSQIVNITENQIYNIRR